MKTRNVNLTIRWSQDTIFGYTDCDRTQCVLLEGSEDEISEDKENVLKNVRKAFRSFNSEKYHNLTLTLWQEDETGTWRKTVRIKRDYDNLRNGTVKKIEYVYPYNETVQSESDCTKEIALKALMHAIDLAIANRI